MSGATARLGAVSQALAPAREQLGEYWRWWTGELAGMLPASLRARLTAPPPTLLAEPDGAGGFRFTRLERGIGRPASAAEARRHFDTVIESTVEAADFEALIAPASLDLVLCLDVLEHLVDPWTVVRRASPLLKPGGRLILSVPNIRNWKFIWRLLSRGDFHYRDAGLLDRTHLRFFVRETARDLAAAGGLVPIGVHDAREYSAIEFRNLLNTATFGATSTLIAKQWIAVAERR